MKKILLVVCVPVLLVLAGGAVFAGGAGGLAWSDQHYVSGLSSSTLATTEIGGFGYGVSAGGTRTGGFGYAIYSEPGTDSLAGGVGGVIVGQESRTGPLTFAVNLWTGAGGVSETLAGIQSGHVVLFGEANVELGIAVTPWMQLSGYAGMQGLADVHPRTGIGGQLLRYSPILGMRLAWGSFPSARW